MLYELLYSLNFLRIQVTVLLYINVPMCLCVYVIKCVSCSTLQCSCSFSCYIVLILMATKRRPNRVNNHLLKMPVSWLDFSLEDDKTLPVQKPLSCVFVLEKLCLIFKSSSSSEKMNHFGHCTTIWERIGETCLAPSSTAHGRRGVATGYFQLI